MKSKVPTIKEIAKIANVSAMTVSRALNNNPRVREKTRKKIQTIAKQLGYRPNRIARSLVSKRSQLISLIVADIANQYFSELARGIEDKAREYGYNVIFCSTDNDSETLKTYVRLMMEVGVDGFILAAVRLKEPIVEELADQHFPVVLVNRELKEKKANSVVIDNHAGAYLVVEHLINCGYEKIGIITGDLNLSTGIERFEGYRKALRDYGIPFHEDYSSQGPFTQAHGCRAATKMLSRKNRPEAIFAASDNIALGVMDAAGSLGLRIPEDLAVVGFDDTEFSSNAKINLTTVSQKKYEMGAIGVQMLLDLINGQAHGAVNNIVLEPELIIRKSCGCQLPKKKRATHNTGNATASEHGNTV
jgi:LacI family transcriptional regulator